MHLSNFMETAAPQFPCGEACHKSILLGYPSFILVSGRWGGGWVVGWGGGGGGACSSHWYLQVLCLFLSDAAKECLKQGALSRASCEHGRECSEILPLRRTYCRSILDASATRCLSQVFMPFCEDAQNVPKLCYLQHCSSFYSILSLQQRPCSSVHLPERVSALCHEPETLAMHNKRFQNSRFQAQAAFCKQLGGPNLRSKPRFTWQAWYFRHAWMPMPLEWVPPTTESPKRD